MPRSRVVSIRERTREVVLELLRELGNPRALEEFSRRGDSAHLERDLGLGSLERVELILRLDHACGVRLPDPVVAEADTLGDLIGAVARAEALTTSGSEAAPLASPPAAAAASPSSTPEQDLSAAETLTEVLRLRGRFDAHREHIHLYEEGEKLRTLTYGQLFDQAQSLGVELVRRGLQSGQTVAIMLPTCAEFFLAFSGILLAGGVPVPIYPPFRTDRIEEYARRQAGILRNAEARFLITFRQARGLARLLAPRVPSLRGVLEASRLVRFRGASAAPETEVRPVEDLPHRARAADIAFLQYTSGSTGSPKGVVLTHANLLANIRSIISGIGVRDDDVVVSWLPLYHDMGLIGAWMVPLYLGLPLVVMSPLAFLSRPERWFWAIHRHRGTLSPAPNFAYELCVRKIADRDLEGLDLSSWRAALNGAEPVRPETLKRFAQRFARYGFHREALMPVYGLAEASLAVSAPPMGSGPNIDQIQREPFEREGRAVPAGPEDRATLEFVSAGKPLPGFELRIVDAEGRALTERVEGQLWFRGASATQGYYRNPQATREILRAGGWVDSGDLAYRADGDLFITGRAKDIIIKAGRNLVPHEVEGAAARAEGVRAGCVVAFGVPDERSGTEKLVVAAEARDICHAARIAGAVARHINASLGLPPDRVEVLPPHSIPKTSSGKLRRAETRRLYLEGRLGRRRPPMWLQLMRLAARSAAPRTTAALRDSVRRIAELTYGTYALATFTAVFTLTWLAVFCTPRRRAASRLTRLSSRLMLALAGVHVRVENGELLGEHGRSGPWIFAPNHTSYLDILVALGYLPSGSRFVAKGEVVSMPLVRTFMRRTGHFSFRRISPRARIELTEEVERALRRGESVVIYPEGTFTSARGVRPFQLGAFKSAVDTGRPICPVAFRGAREILRDKTYIPRPGRVTVVFGPLVIPETPNQRSPGWQEIVRLRDATREIIARHSGEPLL